jgi:RNA ligase (TIGR02306 family)
METSTEELQAVAAAEPQPTVAVIGVITETHSILGADRIHLAVADCGEAGTWSGVVPKDMIEGEKVLVLLQDALLPEGNPRWAFMEQRHWRVRMARFKGVPSECVILPVVGEELDEPIGSDVGLALGITKYSKPLPAEMAGVAKGNFPSFIPKTDEPNFQRVRDRDRLMDCEWYATVKYDGTSGTAYVLEDAEANLHLCSRNLELEDGEHVYAQMARKYNLVSMPEGICLQFEIIGPGIQGNPLGLAENEIRVFTGYDVGDGKRGAIRLGRARLEEICAWMRLPVAEIVDFGGGARTNAELQKMAEIKYHNGRHGEGVVIRGWHNEFSLKAINLLYKESL